MALMNGTPINSANPMEETETFTPKSENTLAMSDAVEGGGAVCCAVVAAGTLWGWLVAVCAMAATKPVRTRIRTIAAYFILFAYVVGFNLTIYFNLQHLGLLYEVLEVVTSFLPNLVMCVDVLVGQDGGGNQCGLNAFDYGIEDGAEEGVLPQELRVGFVSHFHW